MNRSFLIFVSLIGMLLFSCNKNDNDNNDNNNPPATARDWFKLKTILYTSKSNNSNYSDSTNIDIDSANNKIIVKEYKTGPGGKDTSTKTYTYNSNYQLVLYEHVDTYDFLYISRMEFVRDVNGQVTKVLSGYKNSLMATSEGTVKYDKRGDTTLITYLDSAKKHPQGYPDAQDFYQVALLGGKLIYQQYFPIKSGYGDDNSILKYEYDGSGNLVTVTDQDSKIAPPIVYTYQRGSEVPKELQKYIAQLTGDLFWFTRTKFLFFLDELVYDKYIVGNAVQTVKKNNAAYLSFTNTFDANGNLTSVSYQTLAGGSVPSLTTYTEKYKYRP